MAELDVSGGGHKKGPGVKKSKKLSTRVDLTPMVDLGFLLITFFIFTTTMSQPTAMKLNLPKETDNPENKTPVKVSGALTIIPSKDDQVFYYEGDDPTKLKNTPFKDIRNVIINKKRHTPPKDFVVIIKPDQDATYKNTVDILDEMTINQVEYYAMADITPLEYQLVQAAERTNGGN